MTGQERRARQAQIEAEFEADANARPNIDTERPLPAADSPDYCAIARDRRHSFWTSKDGRRHCYYCCTVREAR